MRPKLNGLFQSPLSRGTPPDIRIRSSSRYFDEVSIPSKSGHSSRRETVSYLAMTRGLFQSPLSRGTLPD